MDFLLHLDREIFLALNFDGGVALDSFFWIMSARTTWIPLYMLILGLIWRRYGWRYMVLAAIFILLTVVAADQICNLFKTTLPKLRPTRNPELEGLVHTVRGYRGGLYGTASAHAATTCGIALFSARLLSLRWFAAGMVLWATLVSYSRIYLGVHYLSDIFLGATLGIVIALGMLRLFRYCWSLYRRSRPQL